MAAPRFIWTLRLAGLFSALVLPPLCGLAQPAPVDSVALDSTTVHWERSLPPLTITASRLPIVPAQAPARIEVIDSTALARTGAHSVASVLAARAGLHVRRYGDGGLATPALRGTGASQTALLLDGQRISNPQLGHLDLSLLPTVLLRSVEVMHGPASPIHGSNGLGGAIHLRTVRPRSSLQLRGTAHAGAFGERGGSLLVGGPLSPRTAVLAAAEYQSTDGNFPYLDEARFPPQTVRRRNADRTRHSIFGRVESKIGRHHLYVSGWFTQADRGLPPPSSVGPAQERQWDTQFRLWARDRVALDRGHITANLLSEHTRLRYANPAQNLDETGRTWTHTLDATYQASLSPRWTGAGGLSGSVARARHPSLQSGARQEHLSTFAEGIGRYGRLRLYPALRTDAYWMPGGIVRLAASPRLGLNLQPIADWSFLHLKAQLGRAFRVPTFNDRYWQPGGNPTLRPERSWGGDVGLRLDRPNGHVEVTAFGHRRRDQIVWQPTGQDYWAPRNVGRVRALGAELSADRDWRLRPHLPLQTGFTYTVTDARNRSDPSSASYDELLRYVPRDELKVHATVSWGPAALTMQFRYTGRRPLTSDGSQFLDAHGVANTRLRIEHSFSGVRTALSVDVDNTLDAEYHTLENRPMPPRHARIRLLVAP